MRVLARLVSGWNTLFRKSTLERDLDDELEAAVETLADRYASSGMDASAARCRAIAELAGFGGVDGVKATIRDNRIGAGLDALGLDLRYAWRGLWKAPVLTAVIVFTLGVGVGASTAIFSVVHTMLLAPLPYRDADRLLFVWADRSATGYPRAPVSGPELGDLRAASTTCSAFGAIWASGTVALTGDREPEQLRSAFVTTNFFEVLGAESALGRTFRAEDGAPGAPPTILLGWDLFQRRFGGDPGLVGRQILVNGESTTVIGIMPDRFRLLLPPDASVPDHLQAWHPFWADLERHPRENRLLRVVAKMRPDATIADARADLARIASGLSRQHGTAYSFTAVPLQADDVREIRAPLLALFAGVGILLTIACVNVASLLVARAAGRASETAVRVALGASRSRLLRQALVEGLLLTLLGAGAGLTVGYAGLRALVVLAPDSLSRLAASRIDIPVLGFTLGVSLVWGVLFSLAPLTELFRSNAAASLQKAGRSNRSPLRVQTRALLVVAQIALSVVLLVGAGLLLRAFVEVLRVDPGFRADRHVTFRIAMPGDPNEHSETAVAFVRDVQRRLAALPGATGVGAISNLPYDDLPNWALSYRADVSGDIDTSLRYAGAASADTRAITPGLFETLGVRLVEGRLFTEEDDSRRSRDPVVIVDDMLARQLWPNRSAIGQNFLIGQGIPQGRASVVGVVQHVKLRSLVDALTPQIFIPFALWSRNPMAYVVSTAGDPMALAADIRTAMRAVDPNVPIYDVRSMQVYVDSARATRRFTVLLAVAFALSALLLTSVGVYGVLACVVVHRRQEFGVRRALGADPAQVMREVVRECAGFAGVGCIAGLAAAILSAELLRSQLYGVDARDPLTYVAGLAVILVGAALASWIPVRRALAISPMDALRAP